MAAFSDYLEVQLLNHIFDTAAGTTFARPAGLFVALFTAAPTDAGGGTEVTGGAYARVDTTGNWTISSVGGVSKATNTADIIFPAPTAAWGQVVAVGIFDAATAGNLLFHAPLTTPKTVNAGDPAPKFLANSLTITLD